MRNGVADLLSFLVYFYFFTRSKLYFKFVMGQPAVIHETWFEHLKGNFQLPVWLNVLNVYKLNAQKSNFLRNALQSVKAVMLWDAQVYSTHKAN